MSPVTPSRRSRLAAFHGVTRPGDGSPPDNGSARQHPGVRRRVAGLAVVLGLAASAVGIASVIPPTKDAAASPIPFIDPTNPANCHRWGEAPVRYTGPVGGSDSYATYNNPAGPGGWCRGSGLDVTLTSTGGKRHAGQYLVNVDGSTYAVYCDQDNAAHPRVSYTASAFGQGDIVSTGLTGRPLAHPEAVNALLALMKFSADSQGVFGTMVDPFTGTVYSNNESAAATWALQHYIVGDTTGGGITVVSDLNPFSTATAAANNAEALMASFVNNAALLNNVVASQSWSQANVTAGPITFTANFSSDGGPWGASLLGTQTTVSVLSASNVRLNSGGALAAGGSLNLLFNGADMSIDAGGVHLQVQAIDPTQPVELTLGALWFAPGSWQVFFSESGQQSTGFYYEPGNRTIAVPGTLAPVSKVYLRFTKTSATPGVGVAGGQFTLQDANGVYIEGWTSDGSGVWNPAAIDTAIHPGPYTFTETVAPPGLTVAAPVVVAGTISTDPAAPTPASMSDTPQQVYLRFTKTSTDAGISVAGGTFELRDANGVVLSTWTSDATGVWNIGPLVEATLAAPLTIVETVAPAGLAVSSPVVIAGPYSRDSAAPTTASMSDTPKIDLLSVGKRVPAGTPAPAGDLSGFQFSVTRSDGFVPAGSPVTTGANGRIASPLTVPRGTYTVCEIGMPAWASAVLNNPTPGCQQVVVNGTGGASVDFVYDNALIAPAGATMLSTAVAKPGDAITEYVWTKGAPTATRSVNISTVYYQVVHGATPTCSASEQVGTATASATIGDPEQVTAVRGFIVPASASNVDIYAVSTVADQATGAVYFAGRCGDPLEMLSVPQIATSTVAVSEGDSISDNYTVAGLPTNNASVTASTATGTFVLWSLTGMACDNSTLDKQLATTSKTVTNGSGTSNSVAITVTGQAVRFVESLTVTTTRNDKPSGWTLPIPGSSGGTVTTTVTIPGQGGCAETTPRPTGKTTVKDKVLVGQPAVDTLVTTGFGTADLSKITYQSGPLAGRPVFSNVTANWTLHAHEAMQPLAQRVCDAVNKIGATSAAITGDGMSTATITDYSAAAGKQVSWNEWYEGDRLNIDGSVTHWVTTPTGCQEANETAIVPSLSTTASTSFLNGVESSTDTVRVLGLGDGSLLTSSDGTWTVTLIGGLHGHAQADVSAWECTAGNKLAAITPLTIGKDGSYVTGPIGPDVYGSAAGGAVSYAESFTVTNPAGAIVATSTPAGCKEAGETSWVPKITTRTNPTRNVLILEERSNFDIADVSGVPTGQAVTVHLDVYRLVPGNAAGVTPATACVEALRVQSYDYTATGSGSHQSPTYVIPDNEVGGVQYVHQETLLIGGKQVAKERCGATTETTTIERPTIPRRLIVTS